MTLDWQQKAAALAALAELSIKCRKAGDWYVSQNVEIKDNSVLRGEYGNGSTPQEAIEDHWQRLVTNLEKSPLYLVARAGGGEDRRAVRWNGFMWQDVPEPKREAA